MDETTRDDTPDGHGTARPSRTLTVVGQGNAAASPDTALLRLSVVATRPTPAEALAAARGVGSRVVEALGPHVGANAPDSQERLGLVNVAVHQETRWDPQGQPVPQGHSATVSYQAELALEQVAPALDAASGTAGEQFRIDELSLFPADTGQALREARDAAWEDARERAERWAELAGAALGEVLLVQEGLANPPAGPGPALPKMMAVAADSSFLPAGERQVGATVTVMWALVAHEAG